VELTVAIYDGTKLRFIVNHFLSDSGILANFSARNGFCSCCIRYVTCAALLVPRLLALETIFIMEAADQPGSAYPRKQLHVHTYIVGVTPT
jgi:hypothetical protein